MHTYLKTYKNLNVFKHSWLVILKKKKPSQEFWAKMGAGRA